MADPRVHPSAVVDPAAVIGEDCEIGPFCVVGPEVRLGRGVVLKSHVVIAGDTSIGHGTAYCMAMEALSGAVVSPRAETRARLRERRQRVIEWGTRPTTARSASCTISS